jgi:hypothetical protein
VTDLVIVVPSRGRPEAVAELALACKQTCTAGTRLLVVVDDNDETMSSYDALHGGSGPYDFDLGSFGRGNGHVAAINRGALWAMDTYKPFAIGKLDDDHRPRSVGWDTSLIAALRQMGTGIAYGNDLFQGAVLPTAPVMTADIVAALGYMGPPSLRHLMVDNFWRDLGDEAGCLRYLPGVVVEHMHPLSGKVAWTEGHQRVNAPAAYERDSAAYAAYRAEQFEADVAKVRALRSVPA